MKRIIIIYLMCLVCCTQITAQDQIDTYIATVIPTEEKTSLRHIGDSAVMTTIQYFDGLSRPIVTVNRSFSPSQQDIFTSLEYDHYGREVKQWLPATRNGQGSLPNLQNRQGNARTLYGDNNPYSQTNYESSPLGRKNEELGPGAMWHNASKAKKTEYMSNLVEEGVLSCKRYLGASVTAVNYPSGTLFVLKTTDEDENAIYTFTDKQGKTLLARQVVGNDMYDTYYIYDTSDNLTHVLPPMINNNMSVDNLYEYAYLYEYDNRKRCTLKKLPGCEPIKYVYDNANRLIFVQDGNQRIHNEWTFIFYDAFGRESVRGICISATPLSIDGKIITTTYSETGVSILGSGYSLSQTSAIALEYQKLLNANYYDSYSFLNLIPSSAHKTALTYQFESGINANDYGQQYSSSISSGISAKGLLTGTQTSLLGSGDNVFSAFYYDDKKRMVQSRSTNHANGHEKNYFAYTFTGKPLKHYHHHTAPSLSGGSDIKQLYLYEYDRVERLKKINHQLNSAPVVTLVENNYDNIGRLQKKIYHGLAANSLKYTYNVRNWITEVTSNCFTQNLYYNTGNGTLLYNGNISSMTWKAGDESTIRGYKFAYDGLNRLTAANYGEGTTILTNADRFTEKVTGYDKHGNITGLQRYGKTTASTYGLIDHLSFGYVGNRMKYVNDAVTTNPVGQSFQFVNGSNSTGDEYTYDANGNMTKDLNKNITDIQYNLLNLPTKLQLSTGGVATYTYDAAGVKRNVTHQGAGVSKTTDYCGNVIYENGALSKILTDEGYITLSGTTPTYHYYLKDHLGNNRVVLNQNGTTVEQVNHYYPFGGLFDQTSETLQAYKYNGKELDRTYGIDLYDYSARFMDGAVGRFTTMDPLAEKYYSVSPYGYVMNNPVKFVDPDGRFVGTLSGGFIGGIAGGVNAYFKGQNIWIGAAEGAISGAIAGAAVDITIATGGAGGVLIAAAAVGGGLGSAVGDVAGQVLQSAVVEGTNLNTAMQNIDYGQTFDKAVTGAVAGTFGGVVGASVGKATSTIVNSTKGVQSTMSGKITETAKTLNGMGASEATINKAVGKIVTGMGNVGAATNNTVQTIKATTTVATEVVTRTVLPIDELEKKR